MGRKQSSKSPKPIPERRSKKPLRSSSSHRDPSDPAIDREDIEDIFLPRFLARVEDEKAYQASFVFIDDCADLETLLNARGFSLRVGPNASEFRILKAEERRLQAQWVNNWG